MVDYLQLNNIDNFHIVNNVSNMKFNIKLKKYHFSIGCCKKYEYIILPANNELLNFFTILLNKSEINRNLIENFNFISNNLHLNLTIPKKYALLKIYNTSGDVSEILIKKKKIKYDIYFEFFFKRTDTLGYDFIDLFTQKYQPS